MTQFLDRGPTTLGWPVNVTVMWHFLLGACGMMLSFFFVCKAGKKPLTMLKTVSTTVQNLVTWATKHSGFVLPLRMWNYTRSLKCLIVVLTRVPGNLQAVHFVFHVVDLWHIWQESLVWAGLSPLPPHGDNKQTGPIAQHILNY